MSMRRVQLFVVAVGLLGVHASVVAQESRQERLFAIVPVSPDLRVTLRKKIIEIDTRSSNFGAVLREWPLTVEAPFFEQGLHAVDAGRYLVWISGIPILSPYRLSPIRLSVFDTLSGNVRAFDNVVDGPIVAVDNKRGRVFLAELLHIVVVDARTGTISRFPRAPGTPAVYPLPPGLAAAYAEDVDRLFVTSSVGSNVDVFDVGSGTIVGRISIESLFAFGLATDRAGTRLYTTEPRRAVSAYDTATSRLIARTSLLRHDTEFDFRIQFDAERRRLLVGSLVVFDADTLTRLGGVQGTCAGDPECGMGGPRSVFVGPRSPLLFFTSKTFVDYAARSGGCATAPLESRDPVSGQLLAVADLAPLATAAAFNTGGCVIEMAMTTVPAAPRALTSDVHARRITLAWTDPGNTTHFQVEGGSGPGLADLDEQAVGGTSLTVDDVPPGTYYVRVRAVNFVGRSLPAEIRVVVP